MIGEPVEVTCFSVPVVCDRCGASAELIARDGSPDGVGRAVKGSGWHRVDDGVICPRCFRARYRSGKQPIRGYRTVRYEVIIDGATEVRYNTTLKCTSCGKVRKFTTSTDDADRIKEAVIAASWRFKNGMAFCPICCTRLGVSR